MNYTTTVFSHLLEKHKHDKQTTELILFYIKLQINREKTIRETKNSSTYMKKLYNLFYK